jgi:hypothetical protein
MVAQRGSIVKINVYAAKGMQHQVDRAESFCRGLARHGFTNSKVLPLNNPQTCDLAVFWGMHHSGKARHIQEQNNRPWLMMERGYVGDRFHWTAMGYNGLNGRADFFNKNSPPERWRKYFDGWLKPWHDGDYVLLAGQVLQDASIKNLGVNYQHIANEIAKHTSLPIHFRKHPHKLTQGMATPSGCVTSPASTIEEALAGARVCVTVNSNSGVDAMLAGTPVINLDCGSMVWDLAQHDYSQIDKPPFPDREQWAYDIAYAQWSPEEIENGDAWEHLKRKFE